MDEFDLGSLPKALSEQERIQIRLPMPSWRAGG